MSKIQSALALFLCIGICLVTGLLGSMVTASSVQSWYPTLERPTWNPPDFLFAPVWTTLFVMMGVAVWLVWRRSGEQPLKRAYALFALQLMLNALWSFLFFGLRRPGLALIEIVVLFVVIAATAVEFGRIRRAAGLLLVPYLLWVGFATALNGTIWWLNR